MFKKTIFVHLVLAGLLIFVVTGRCFADAASEFEQARVHMANCRYEQALTGYQSIVSSYPGTDYALRAKRGLVTTYIRMQKVTESQEAIEQLITDFGSEPDLPVALLEIAKNYAAERDYKQAKQVCQQIVAQYPDSVVTSESQILGCQFGIRQLIKQGDIDAAKSATDKLKADFSANPQLARYFRGIARTYRSNGYVRQANELCARIAQQYPADVYGQILECDIERNNIIALLNQGQDSQALSAFDTLAANLPQNLTVPGENMIAQIALACDKLGKSSLAENIYGRIPQIYPGSGNTVKRAIDVAQTRITAKIIAGDYSGAQSAIDQLSVDFAPELHLTRAILIIGERYSENGLKLKQQGHDAGALADFQRSFVLLNQVIEGGKPARHAAYACVVAGNICRQIEDYQGALDYYQRMVRDWPGHYLAGHSLFMVGRNNQKLKESGQKATEEADAVTRAAYQRLVDEYPDCKAARAASDWLKRNP